MGGEPNLSFFSWRKIYSHSPFPPILPLLALASEKWWLWKGGVQTGFPLHWMGGTRTLARLQALLPPSPSPSLTHLAVVTIQNLIHTRAEQCIAPRRLIPCLCTHSYEFHFELVKCTLLASLLRYSLILHCFLSDDYVRELRKRTTPSTLYVHAFLLLPCSHSSPTPLPFISPLLHCAAAATLTHA